MRTIKGYEDKEIIEMQDTEAQEILKQGNPRQIISLYLKLREAHHYQTNEERGNTAYKQAERLKTKVQKLLEEAGWEAHIVNPCQNEKSPSYIHAAAGASLQVHQVPFSQEWNITLLEEELFTPQGNLRTRSDTLLWLKERIGEAEIRLDGMPYELTYLGKIDEKTRKIIAKIMKEEGLDILHEVNGQEFRCGSQSFRWFNNEEEAIQEAREYLEDGGGWREAVAAGSETRSLVDWIEDVLNTDGWGHVLSSWDGCERWIGDIPYIRIH